MYAETGIECRRLRALMEAVTEFTPEPTGEQLTLVYGSLDDQKPIISLVVCSASPAL